MMTRLRCLVPLVGVAAAMLLWFLAAAPARVQAQFPDVCKDNPQNLTTNCKFNNGLTGWTYFHEGGTEPDVSVQTSSGNCHSPDCPALYLFAEEWFIGGVYQRVSGVTPGHTYWANVVLLWYDPAGAEEVEDLDVVGRSVGIDPYGGTDPTSSHVVWGEQYWKSFTTCPNKFCTQLFAETMARNSTVTVFVRIEDTWKTHIEDYPVPPYYVNVDEHYWIDDVGMIDLGPAGEVTATITITGGSLASDDASTQIEFPPGAVATSTLVTYVYDMPPDVFPLTGMDRFFTLTASQGGAPLTTLARPITVSVALPANRPVNDGTEALYWLDGTDWVTTGITTTSRTTTTLVSLVDHLTSFGVLGQSERLFLPASLRDD